MLTPLHWQDVGLRLGLAAMAGTVIGINRGQHGRAAGLRTMLLVCTGSALAMILADWLTRREGGGGGESIANPARFAQGIMAGMGFLGAGAIIREGGMIRGVTTAATLWFLTILGLSFGLGMWKVALVAFGIALFALFLLPYAEEFIHADRYAAVTVVMQADAMNEQDLRSHLESFGVVCEKFTVDYHVATKLKTVVCNIQFHINDQLRLPQEVIAALAQRPGVVEVRWQ